MSGLGVKFAQAAATGLPHPANVVVRLRGDRVRRTPAGALRGVRIKAEFYVGSMLFATGHGDALIVNERAYSKLRNGQTEKRHGGAPRYPGATVDPRSVGHSSESDVVLSATHTADIFTLSLDLNNVILFDHPLDHIAGMIPAEATRQVVRLLRAEPDAELTSAEFHYAAALEFDGEVTIHVELDGDRAAVRFIQADKLAVSGEVTFAHSARAGNVTESDDQATRVRFQSDRPELPLEERMSTSHEFAATDLPVL